jgi:hypothetical protein
VNADDLVVALPVGGHSNGGLTGALEKSQASSRLFKAQTDYKHLVSCWHALVHNISHSSFTLTKQTLSY